MRKHKEKREEGLNVWRSYSDMMAGILLLFVLIMCVTLFQSQINYEASLKERDEKLVLQEEYTQQILSQQTIVENQQTQLSTQDELLAAQKKQLDELAAQLKTQQEQLDAQSVTLSSQKQALDEKTSQLAAQEARIDKIIGVKAEVIEALSTEFTAKNISVNIDPTDGSLVLDSSVLFEYDETELSKEGKEVLSSVLPIYCAVLLQENYLPYLAEINVDGYTDSTGGYEYNLELSQKRSLAVAQYLLSISAEHLSEEQQKALLNYLTVNGHSSSNLILDESGNEDAAASRRVEVKFRLRDEDMIEELREILSEESSTTESTEAQQQ
ncbi:MAG: OmpA family protein [Eubacteriales bacterium]|nr:OmpA family protein [Eubacteriales bacterium]